MAIRSMSHVAICTADLDRTVDFWTAHLGFVEEQRWEWPTGVDQINQLVGLDDSAARAALLSGHGAGVEVFEYRVPTPPPRPDDRPASNLGYAHVCLETDDIDADVARLAAAGMRFWADPAIDGAGNRLIYGRDPDGNLVELHQPAGR